MPSATLDLVAPTWQWVPDYESTLGAAVADFCCDYGFVPDPEQRLILDGLFAKRSNGRSIRDVGICAPRQNIKTGVLKMAALGWLFVLDLPLVTWSAHEYTTAQETFRDLCRLIENNPDLDREVLRTSRGKTGIRRGFGDEAIELRGDRRIEFRARTRDGGRGLTGDRVVFDEAMKLAGGTIAALVPTLRAVPDPQLVFAGSGGLLESRFWRSVRDRGRPGGDDSLAWYEWGDQRPWECGSPECLHEIGTPGCALDDVDRLAAVNSALGRRISMESLRADRKTFAAFPIKYATETLGWWEDPPSGDVTDDTLAKWPTLANPAAKPTDPLALALDVSHDNRSAALVVVGNGVAELVDYRIGQGIEWVPARVVELREKHSITAFGVAMNGPAKALLPKLPEDTVKVPGGEADAACIALAQDVQAGSIAYRPKPALDMAATRAVRQLTGDGWHWSRAKSALAEGGCDISPLWALVIARHLAATAPPPYDPLANFMPNL